ncbi:HdeD family acid-resistance protein [Zongyangia hominis]|uniref:DUF308 domain-containing protein n=1 Tax=Zongyangia hominis TaxID=2763677 RepID=A0A926EG69_9FIRM|nr:DUF308 domain-containing protein [Zongyangia hominis]MBC8571241.1 DUF308 domain-containing protein [Zongyangia hominis]
MYDKDENSERMSVMQTKKIKGTFLLIAILNIVLGLCLIIWPQISAVTLCYLFGALTAAAGLFQVICYFSRDSYGIPLASDLALGLMSLIVGAILILHPGDVITLLPIVIGILVVLNSVFLLEAAIDVKRAGIESWWAILLMAVIGAVLGVLLLFHPFAGASALMILIGAALVVSGVENICAVIYLKRYVKENYDVETIYIRK